MDNNRLKNMVVLKNLPSNVVDEAIVILKPNVKLKKADLADNKKNKNGLVNKTLNPKEYIVNEAQMIISNYISSLERPKQEKYKIDKKIQKECKRFKIISAVLGLLLLISFFK